MPVGGISLCKGGSLKTAFIYSLVCPLAKQVRYVGKSNDPVSRHRGHISAAEAGMHHYQANWIRTVLAAGKKPKLKILFRVPADTRWQDAERFFIASARHFGFKITNTQPGGEGFCWDNKDSVKRLIASMRTAWTRPETRAKHEAVWTDEFRKAFCAIQQEIHARPEVRKKRSETLKRVKGTPEARKNASVKSIASKTPELRAAVSKQVLSNWSDPAHRVKRSANIKAAVASSWADPVKRAARIAKLKATWALPGKKEQFSEMLRKLNAEDPSINEKRSATLKKTFADPVVKAKFLKANAAAQKAASLARRQHFSSRSVSHC